MQAQATAYNSFEKKFKVLKCVFCLLFRFFSFHNKSPKQDTTLCCSRFQCIALRKCFYCHAVPKAPACLVICYIIPLFPSRGNILVPIASSFLFFIVFYVMVGYLQRPLLDCGHIFQVSSLMWKKKKMLQQSHLDHSRSSVEWRLRWPSSRTWRSWAQSSGWSGCSGTLWRSGTLCRRVGARWGRTHLLLGKKRSSERFDKKQAFLSSELDCPSPYPPS